MRRLKLEINQKIEVIKDEEAFKSVIQDVTDDGYSINIPVNNGVYLPLHNGEECELMVYTEDGGCFKFKGKIIERRIESSLYLYKITLPYNIKKIQRRDFVRVKAVEYTFYSKITNDEELNWKKGIIVDLSGGGMKLKIDDEATVGDDIRVNIIINEDKFNVVGKVVRLDRTEDKQFMCGIQFVDVTERDRDKIVSKVFQLMRKQRGVL
ncbi:MAG: flagellar brake protein [Clostridium sp.]